VRQERRVTILDVAARAGVHPATVSRTLTRPEKVAPATRKRVEAAVEKLGFVPNRAAQVMKTGRTGTIAVIVPDITNPHFGSMVRAVERAARTGDLQVLLADTSEHPREETRAVRTLVHDVDGFVVLSPRRLHRELDALGTKPAVFVNRPVRGYASVLLRSAPAVHEALLHLAAFGHRKLAFLGGPTGSWAAGERKAAVRKTGEASGMRVITLDAAAPTFEAATDAAPRIVATGATAVIAFNDQMALGVIAGLTRLGVPVPAEVSVVGFDDVPMAAMVAPPLTTIGLPTEEAGTTAVSLLRESATETTELFGSLVVRESTGPVTKRRASAAANGARRPSGGGRA
jgi:LacI family transcriptional regulator, galactose operon repressor